MLARLCIAVTAAAAVCGSAHGQSTVLEEGQSGPFFEAGYVRGSGISGGAANAGYAFSDKFDLGLTYEYARISTSTWVTYARARSASSSVGGQFADFYPLRPDRSSAGVFFGLHEACAFFDDASENPLLSGGVSLNVLVPTAKDAALVFTAQFRGTRSTKFGGDTETSGIFGALLYGRLGGRDTVGLTVQYDLSDARDTFAIGLSYTVGRS